MGQSVLTSKMSSLEQRPKEHALICGTDKGLKPPDNVLALDSLHPSDQANPGYYADQLRELSSPKPSCNGLDRMKDCQVERREG